MRWLGWFAGMLLATVVSMRYFQGESYAPFVLGLSFSLIGLAVGSLCERR